MWDNPNLPHRRSVGIPHHSKPLKRHTKDSILDTLEGDLDAYEENNLGEIEIKNGHH